MAYPTDLDTNATLLVAVDLATSTLSAALTASATSLTLADATLFNSNGGRLKIDNEIIAYTGKTSNTLTGLTRGYGNSTAAAHVTGTTVDLVVDADYHNNLKDAIINTQTKIGITGSESFVLVAGDTMTGNLTLPDAFTLIREDARTNTVDVPVTIRSTTTGTPAANIGTGLLFQGESADESPSDFGQLDFVATDVGAASEDTVLDVLLRTAGAALGGRYRLQATGAYLLTVTHALTAARTLTVPDRTGTVMTDPMTAQGDLVYRGATAPATLVAGTSGQYLKTQGAAANPVWADVVFKAALTSAGNYDATTTLYSGIGGYRSAITNEELIKTPVPYAGTVKNLYVHLSAAPGGSNTIVITLRKNGAGTALTVTIGTGTTGNDTSNSVAVVAGDELSFSWVPTGGSGQAGDGNLTFEFQAT